MKMKQTDFNEIQKGIEEFQKFICKVSKKELAYVLRYTLHPHYLEALGVATLSAIADFNGYYPLQLNEIAKDFDLCLDTIRID